MQGCFGLNPGDGVGKRRGSGTVHATQIDGPGPVVARSIRHQAPVADAAFRSQRPAGQAQLAWIIPSGKHHRGRITDLFQTSDRTREGGSTRGVAPGSPEGPAAHGTTGRRGTAAHAIRLCFSQNSWLVSELLCWSCDAKSPFAERVLARERPKRDFPPPAPCPGGCAPGSISAINPFRDSLFLFLHRTAR